MTSSSSPASPAAPDASRSPYTIGIDIGGTFTKLVAMSSSGDVITRARGATNDSSAASLVTDIREQIARIEAASGAAAAIGIACPGLVRRDARAVHWMKGRLNALEGLDWTTALDRGAAVPVINDGHAALHAETWLGAGRGCRDLVMLTLGTGVGGAILTDGRVLIGSTGRGGHLGHMTVNATGDKDIVNTPGSLENAIGNCTIAKRTSGRFTSTDALIAAHLQGDREASEVWLASIAALAAALASIVNAVDPSRIILGGGITASAGEALFAPLREYMNDVEWRPDGTPVEIVAAQLGDEAGAIGAAKLALEPH
jgi:glucokinase